MGRGAADREMAEQDYNASWTTPGIFFGASASLRAEFDFETMLDANDFSDECTYDSRNPYEDPLYTGGYHLYNDCGGTGSTLVVLAAEPEDGAYIMLIQVVLVSEADTEVLETFQVIGQL